MRSIGILMLIFGLAACTKPKPTPETETSIAFKSVSLRDGSKRHTLRLPDGGQLIIETSPVNEDSAITSVSVMQKEGIAYTADYQTKEYFYSAPPFKDFQIWSQSNKGDLILAPEARHKQHAEAMGLFGDFFEKTLGSGMSSDDAMREAENVKSKLNEIYKAK